MFKDALFDSFFGAWLVMGSSVEGGASAPAVLYDPGVTTFDDILRFVLPSGGRNRSQTRQYMTAVWPHTDAQAAAVAAATRDLPEDFLFVEPFSCFYRAEDYHQGRS
ncbi:peptide-methionine (S)-S-oxide reductase [Aureococcus anophagefferens]|nr:peptide-methionine (S)-S-oxide reductase [Aureococcus anophagefferens]